MHSIALMVSGVNPLFLGDLLIKVNRVKINIPVRYNWRFPSLSELTQIVFNMELTHLGLETPNSL